MRRSKLSRRPPWDVKVGVVVRSRYQRPWVGVIVKVIERSHKEMGGRGTDSPLCYVVPIWDARGNRIPRRMRRSLDAWWLQPIEKTLPSDVNPDWLAPS